VHAIPSNCEATASEIAMTSGRISSTAPCSHARGGPFGHQIAHVPDHREPAQAGGRTGHQVHLR
jgi:hypothetical protein